MKARKSSSILAVTGSSGDNPRTCFTITLNANCAFSRTETTPHRRKKKKKDPSKSKSPLKKDSCKAAWQVTTRRCTSLTCMRREIFSPCVKGSCPCHATLLMTDRSLRSQEQLAMRPVQLLTFLASSQKPTTTLPPPPPSLLPSAAWRHEPTTCSAIFSMSPR